MRAVHRICFQFSKVCKNWIRKFIKVSRKRRKKGKPHQANQGKQWRVDQICLAVSLITTKIIDVVYLRKELVIVV